MIPHDSTRRSSSHIQINGFSIPTTKHTKSSSLRLLSIKSSKATVVTGKSWNKSILDSKTPVLVEFYASWCGPCQMVHRVIDEIAAEYAGKVNCFVLNAVPIVLVFKNGKKCESVIGTMPKEFYVSAFKESWHLHLEHLKRSCKV